MNSLFERVLKTSISSLSDVKNPIVRIFLITKYGESIFIWDWFYWYFRNEIMNSHCYWFFASDSNLLMDWLTGSFWKQIRLFPYNISLNLFWERNRLHQFLKMKYESLPRFDTFFVNSLDENRVFGVEHFVFESFLPVRFWHIILQVWRQVEFCISDICVFGGLCAFTQWSMGST